MSQLTEQDIEEMERVVEKVSPGPWDTETAPYMVTSADFDIAHAEAHEDARFIARARSFVPRAIADLRRLRAENERLEAACRDLAEVAIMRESVASQTAREVDFQRVSAALTAATERAERAERERDELLTECRLWRNEIIGVRASYDLRLEAVIEKFDEVKS